MLGLVETVLCLLDLIAQEEEAGDAGDETGRRLETVIL